MNVVRWLTGYNFYPVKIALQELHETASTIGDAFDIDGYCAELNTAIEVQGIHHYVPISNPNNPEANIHAVLRKTNRHDQMKRIWCESRGINLITIPVSVQFELATSLGNANCKHITHCKCTGSNVSLCICIA